MSLPEVTHDNVRLFIPEKVSSVTRRSLPTSCGVPQGIATPSLSLRLAMTAGVNLELGGTKAALQNAFARIFKGAAWISTQSESSNSLLS